MKKLLAAIITITLFSSCYSYRVFPEEYREFEYKEQKKIAFIENPGLEKEYTILKQSGIFEISDKPADADITIKLYPIQRNLACGNPLVVWAVMLGQLPIYMPDRYQFKFEEINKTDTIVKQFDLHIAKRMWFWDIFAFKKHFKKKSAQALFASYYQE